MGSGLSVMHFDGAVEDSAALEDLTEGVQAFWSAAGFLFPSIYTIQVSNQVEVRAEGDGDLIATLSVPTLTPVVGSANSNVHSAGVGMRVRWPTDGIKNGRRVIGTTFLVPIQAGAFEANGTILGTTITSITTAANTLLGVANGLGAPLSVWSRPTSVGASDGALHPVTGVTVPDQASWLTSRRH